MAKNAIIDVFREVLNELHLSLKFIVGKRKFGCEQNFDIFAKVLNLLDDSIILDQNSRLETDIFHKETNSHDYINYFRHHPEQTKQNNHTIRVNALLYLYLKRQDLIKGYLN